ncbi:asparagine synthase (glutamine-hydrolyzing) [Devosia sp. 2618]|uniref:asparagine synthase (glutamine-hydrolyzing) n=1 Tax=Devosia sp. 2618 TaxID=3156454 RepID=UPI0033959FCD
MCGLVGYVRTDLPQQAGEPLLRAMTDTIAHRGPDAEGLWAQTGIGLGHRRLSIVGLADGQQPMLSADGNLVIVYNGEVFNFVELRTDLESRGHSFRTGSDTEVILHLYAEYGPDCVSYLNGDFAFAIWDQAKRRLLLARDRIGVRPLFYAEHEGGLYFASEIKALLRVPGIEAEIDPIALDEIFTLWAPIPPRTGFKGISELPPAHLMVVDDHGRRIERYWSLDYPDFGETADARPEAEIADELLALLDDATRIRMRADVPVGAYLSGGLDSSITTALATRHTPHQLSTFSVSFASAEHDESEFQQIMAEALGTAHANVHCGTLDIAQNFPQVIAHTERPIVRTAPAPLYLLSGLVREQGLKVVLTGEGADEVFAGYDIFKEDKVRRFSARQPGSSFRPLLFKRLYPYLPNLQNQSAEYLAAFFGARSDVLNDPLASHRPRMRSTAAAKLFFSGDLRATLGGYDAAETLLGQLPEAFARWHPQHQAQYLESRFLLPGYILSSQGDRMAMAHGVEGRFPFLDHRLIEFANRIPPKLTLKGLTEKHILRKATEHLLPPSIGNRTKQPYRAPDSQAFAVANAPDYVRDLMGKDAIAATGLFNPAAVEKLVAKAGTSGVDGFRDNTAYVGILSTQLWDRTFSSGKSSAVRVAAE